MSLEDYGWDATWAAHLAGLNIASGIPARVIAGHRSEYRVHTGETDISAKTAGKLHHASASRSQLPAVGDWVIIETTKSDGQATIRSVLPRKTTFSRKVAGKNNAEQIMATNVDTVWIVSTFGADFNPARLERYVTLVLETGAEPVIVLAKADLAEDTDTQLETAQLRLPDVPIHSVSAKAGMGLEALGAYLLPGHTIAVLGSSGVGKSTLINHYFGKELLFTASVREKDGKGRHTTTHRELILLPSGGLLLDTPGMRELQLWGADDTLEKSFSDIDAIALGCRFSDCTHESEPNCAVNAALESGDLSPERFSNYKKLKSELKFLVRKADVHADRLERVRSKKRTKEHRQIGQEVAKRKGRH